MQKRRGALEEDTGDLLQVLHLATGPRELLAEKKRGVSEEEEAFLTIRDNHSKKNATTQTSPSKFQLNVTPIARNDYNI